MFYERIVRREIIEKGWSGDQKYCAQDAQGRKYLLRISPVDRYERKQIQFQ